MTAAPTGDLDVSVTMWAGLAVLVVAMLAVDLHVFGRGRREVTIRESAVWSVAWLALGLAFAAALWLWKGGEPGAEYLTGYLLERSLSLDNLFVFAVIFSYFGVPPLLQPRVLGWGIALALVLRLGFILIGAALLAAFHVTFYAFGALLLYTAWKLARHKDTQIDPEHNPVLRFVRRRGATPLMAVFVVVATTDLLFAIDSIPAIFAVTREPFIVFAANAFALLGLRALYFVLVGLMDRFALLSYGLAVILAFIGAKMLLIDVWHPPIWTSLAVIGIVLAATTALSARVNQGAEVTAKLPSRPSASADRVPGSAV